MEHPVYEFHVKMFAVYARHAATRVKILGFEVFPHFLPQGWRGIINLEPHTFDGQSRVHT